MPRLGAALLLACLAACTSAPDVVHPAPAEPGASSLAVERVLVLDPVVLIGQAGDPSWHEPEPDWRDGVRAPVAETIATRLRQLGFTVTDAATLSEDARARWDDALQRHRSATIYFKPRARKSTLAADLPVLDADRAVLLPVILTSSEEGWEGQTRLVLLLAEAGQIVWEREAFFRSRPYGLSRIDVGLIGSDRSAREATEAALEHMLGEFPSPSGAVQPR